MEKTNLVEVLFQAPDRVEIEGAFEILNNSYRSHLRAVSPDTSKGYAKLGPESYAFVDNAIAGMEAHEDLRSPFVNMVDLRADKSAYDIMKIWRNSLKDLLDLTDDTLMLLGSDLYKACLIFYNNLKVGAENEVPGAQTLYEQLKPRFEQAARATEPETPVHP